MVAKLMTGLMLAALIYQPAVAEAQSASTGVMPDKGLIIRVMDRLLFIDMGRQEGVQEGDIFDIVDAEVVTHPLSGDTLSVTPRSVGALRVRQVYPKMALAELMHIQAARDPMLMRIAPIQDPERLLEIERFLKQNPMNGGPSSRSALIPGLHQFRKGSRFKGLLFLSAELAALGTGIAYRMSSDDWLNKYNDLPPGLAPDRYDYYFNEASDRRAMSNRLFWAAGALYAYNLIDVMWTGGSSGSMNLERKLSVGMGHSGTGTPVVQLLRRF